MSIISNDFYRKRKSSKLGELGCLTVIILFLISVFAWFQHVYTCFTEHYWGFLIAGALFFPIAIIHGIGIWFGVWH